MPDLDAIVAGGGVAGTATAAALAAQGFEVLLCESSKPSHRRLAGELLHPPAVANLRKLGLLEELEDEGMPVYGFVIVGRERAEDVVLSYSEIPDCPTIGLAIEHADLVRGLQRAAAKRPRVSFRQDTRVTEAWREGARVKATLSSAGVDEECSAPLIVSADGRGSRLRKAAGIQVERGKQSYMVGWCVEAGRLPYPGYGHIFTAGPKTALAYQIGRSTVRVMFETDGGPPTRAALDALPATFRGDVEKAIAEGPGIKAKFFPLTPDRFVSDRLAIVGDAGGCAHPITASGMSFCVDDAMRLARSMGVAHASTGEGSAAREGLTWVDAGLSDYQRARGEAMRVRMALADIISRALGSSDRDGDALKASLINYWGRSRRGRAASMALLAVKETRMLAMAREFASVGMHSLLGRDEDSAHAMPMLVRLASSTTSKALLGPLYDRFTKRARGRGLPGAGY
jgi:2-polyprenyl-6-methoxyphenol hydroxylase-like FAD-dependent oxidoreductase